VSNIKRVMYDEAYERLEVKAKRILDAARQRASMKFSVSHNNHFLVEAHYANLRHEAALELGISMDMPLILSNVDDAKDKFTFVYEWWIPGYRDEHLNVIISNTCLRISLI
jgi:hypothetical protein